MRVVNNDYLAKVAGLSEEKSGQLLNRFRLEFMRFYDGRKLSIEEALAIQLEVEDEQLEEWRKNRIKINEIFKCS